MNETVDVDYVMKYGDPRLKSFPLMQTPRVAFYIVAAYLIFIKIVGPLWMLDRKPYQLRSCMMIYNIILVALNTWVFVKVAAPWFSVYSWRCQPIDFSDNTMAVEVLTACYVFHLSKFIELLDTVFFVLRKKYSQINFLHSFHHTMLPFATWYFVKYGGGGYAVMYPLLNSFVHIWMYSYYGLSALGPAVQKYLWWKKYLTKLQLLQFVVGTIYMGQTIVFPVENCNTRSFIQWLLLSQGIVFFILFTHFYIQTYKTIKVPKKSL